MCSLLPVSYFLLLLPPTFLPFILFLQFLSPEIKDDKFEETRNMIINNIIAKKKKSKKVKGNKEQRTQ